MSTEELSITYRGFTISHRELRDADSFHIEGDNNWSNDKPTLKKIKESIDRMLKEKFERTDVIIPGFGYGKEKGEIIEGIVTSVTEDDAVWVSYKNNILSRSKLSSGVYFDTPENRSMIAEWFSLIDKQEEYEKDINHEIVKLKARMTSPIPAKKEIE